jgi:N-formylglutamate amidohydrolase
MAAGIPTVAAFEPSGASPAKSELVRPSDLVSAQRGDLPIILVAGHGGEARVPGSKDREQGVKVRDANTAELALIAAQSLTGRLGSKPYFVIAQFSRRDADVNRDAGEAYESPAAGEQYNAFHRALKASVDECRARFGWALLIDIHAQAREADAIFRGTRDGRTVKHLLDTLGAEGLIGPDSVVGQLRAAGHHVLPEQGQAAEDVGDETRFDGGFIVAHYGSGNKDGVDSIQFEFGAGKVNAPLRTGRDLAAAIAHFHTRYAALMAGEGSIPKEQVLPTK